MKYGPNHAQVETLLARIGKMSADEISAANAMMSSIRDALSRAAVDVARYVEWSAAWDVSRVAAREAARIAARDALLSVSPSAYCSASMDSIRNAACDAVSAEVVRDLIHKGHYDTLTAPLRAAIGDWGQK